MAEKDPQMEKPEADKALANLCHHQANLLILCGIGIFFLAANSANQPTCLIPLRNGLSERSRTAEITHATTPLISTLVTMYESITLIKKRATAIGRKNQQTQSPVKALYSVN